MADDYTVGIDLGGTYIKGGVCDRAGALVAKDAIPTEADRGADHVIDRMAQLVDAVIAKAGLTKEDVAGVGVGAPGPLSHAEGFIYSAPNLPGFVDIPLRDRMARATGLTASLENDANAAAYGEFTAGAARDVQDMVMLTLGTGIGGGVVLRGELLRGSFDNAGEIGHMIIVPDGRPCPCGQRGCLERYGSANAVMERVQEAVRAGADSSLKPKVDSEEAFDARDVREAMAAGDTLAARIWDETCYYLGLAAVNIRHLLNPEVIVLAGGLINAGDELLTPLNEHFERQSWKIAPDVPQIRLATLGTDAGTIGAAALAWNP
jgi:glucokinase